MASGQLIAVFTPQMAMPPASVFALLDTTNAQPFLAFDAATAWNTVFQGWIPSSYSGGGLTARIVWTSASATSGNCIFNGYVERTLDGTDVIGSDSFAAAQSVTAASPGTAGILKYSTITFTSGAQMDSVTNGERFRFKLERDAANGSDTMTGDARVVMVAVVET